MKTQLHVYKGAPNFDMTLGGLPALLQGKTYNMDECYDYVVTLEAIKKKKKVYQWLFYCEDTKQYHTTERKYATREDAQLDADDNWFGEGCKIISRIDISEELV